MATIVINPLGQSEYKVKVGDIISYTGTEYPSVGSTFDFSISEEFALFSEKEILVFLDRKIVYKNPTMNNSDLNLPQISGADEALVTLLFKANEEGKVILIIEKKFRGNLEHEHKFEITVEA
jgi:hypothetical protein